MLRGAVVGLALAAVLLACSSAATPTPATIAPRVSPTDGPAPPPVTGNLMVASQVDLKDPKGDLVDEDGQKAARNPHVDVLNVSASADGEHLWVGLTLAGTVPDSISTVRQELTYLLMIEADLSGDYDYSATIENREDGDWVGSLTDWATGQTYSNAAFPGVVSVAGNVLSYRIRLTALGSPSTLRIGVITQRAEHEDGTVLAQDDVPANADGFAPSGKWLILN